MKATKNTFTLKQGVELRARTPHAPKLIGMSSGKVRPERPPTSVLKTKGGKGK